MKFSTAILLDHTCNQRVGEQGVFADHGPPFEDLLYIDGESISLKFGTGHRNCSLLSIQWHGNHSPDIRGAMSLPAQFLRGQTEMDRSGG